MPWLTPQANAFLETWLLPTDCGAEFGSGGSTLWFARKVASLISVEHNPAWFAKVSLEIGARGIHNVDYRFCAIESPNSREEYVRNLKDLMDSSLDFVLVDGIYREDCAGAAIPKLKPGGVLIIDNVNLYLPCRSKAPNSIPAEKPAANPAWGLVYQQIAGWRKIWTSNGISDTAFFIKPQPLV